MANKMLIDAAHPEETRVVVVRGNRVEEFDYESANKKQLRGNIYLAKVTRVEPSLQAAFVDYGGNRHGFLAFNEIHSDYYLIPKADREQIKEEEAREAEEQRAFEARQEEAEQRKRRSSRRRPARRRKPASSELVDYISEREGADYLAARQVSEPVADEQEAKDDSFDDELIEIFADPDRPRTAEDDIEDDDDDPEIPDTVGSEDALEEVPQRPKRRRRKIYKIQEVIKRNQIILIQVVKEERGNKGAALTTYLSLAGRYTVLMPNTARGGGISRKITNVKDRKRLREIADNIEVPDGTGLIVRTAGASRTKAEIKRDFDYLLRLWENIRQYTLNTSAPTLIYEEGNLIKRSIRDLYSKEIDEVLVAGDNAYREAKDFMRLIMPSHAKNVHHYKEQEPLFQRSQVERQLNAMFNPQVKLKSGGYIVINQTEALVAVDVNSGKSTREFSIEETALNTNLEAASEVARQLRLRDLAGLIVIDFIDMDERKNNRAVEQMMKNALKNDRARIQVGHISAFGLLEMSRQRLRTGVLEGSTTECPHCMGTGIIRSTESVALYVLRSVEDELQSGAKSNIRATCAPDAALYILNYKRSYLRDIERHYGVSVMIEGSADIQGSDFTIKKGAPGLPGDVEMADKDNAANVVSIDWAYQSDEDSDDEEEERKDEEKGRRKRSRRPRRRKTRDDTSSTDTENSRQDARSDSDETKEELNGEQERRPRRRGRRGGRGRGGRDRNAPDVAGAEAAKTDTTGEGRKTEPDAARPKAEISRTPETVGADAPPSNDHKPVEAAPSEPPRSAPSKESAAPKEPKKRGWWQRSSG